MAKPITSTPFKAMEDEAYHAFREWPIFLVMRQKELERHLGSTTSMAAPTHSAASEEIDPQAVKHEERKPQ